MEFLKQILLIAASLMLVTLSLAAPDGGESPPLPGPGLSYGGIPYGSISGNVAEFQKRQLAPPVAQLLNYNAQPNYAQIQPWH